MTYASDILMAHLLRALSPPNTSYGSSTSNKNLLAYTADATPIVCIPPGPYAGSSGNVHNGTISGLGRAPLIAQRSVRSFEGSPEFAVQLSSQISQRGVVGATRNVRYHKICSNWLDYRCPWDERCHRLHQKSSAICNAYLANRCPFGSNCRRSHPPPRLSDSLSVNIKHPDTSTADEAQYLHSPKHSVQEPLPPSLRMPAIQPAMESSVAGQQQSVFDASSQPRSPKTVDICRLFQRGRCYHSHCRFLHVQANSPLHIEPAAFSDSQGVAPLHDRAAVSAEPALTAYPVVEQTQIAVTTHGPAASPEPVVRNDSDAARREVIVRLPPGKDSNSTTNLAESDEKNGQRALKSIAKDDTAQRSLEQRTPPQASEPPSGSIVDMPSNAQGSALTHANLQFWNCNPDYSGWYANSQSSDGGTEISSVISSVSERTSCEQPASTNQLREPLPPEICRDWKTGHCPRGLLCPFVHGDVLCEPESTGNAVKRQSQLPPQFTRRATDRLSVKKNSDCAFCLLGLCTGTRHAQETGPVPVAPPGLPTPASRSCLDRNVPAASRAAPTTPQPFHSSTPTPVSVCSARIAEPLSLRKPSLEKTVQASSPSQSKTNSENAPLANHDLLTVTLIDHAKLKVAAGFQVQDITTGFETRWVYLNNIPSLVTEADLVPILEPFGHILAIWVPLDNGLNNKQVKVGFAENVEALAAVAALNGAEYFNTTISARLAISNSNNGNGSVSDSTVSLEWDAPGRVGYAGYPTKEEAEAAIALADGIIIKDHEIKAEMYAGLPAIDCYNVKFSGLPPSADEKTLKRFAPAHAIVLQRPNYPSVSYAIEKIVCFLEMYGEVLDISIHPPPYKSGSMKAWVDFVSPTVARDVCASVNGRKLRSLGGCRLRARYKQSISYKLSSSSFDKMSSDIFALRRYLWLTNSDASLTIVDRRSDEDPGRPVVIRLSAENRHHLGSLNLQLKQILHGQKVMDGDKPAWDDFFRHRDGLLFVSELEKRTPSVGVQVEGYRRTITLFGPISDRAIVHSAVLNKVKWLRKKRTRFIPLSGSGIALFMSKDLVMLQSALGPENVILDLAEKRLVIRGDDTAFSAAREAVQSTRKRLRHSGGNKMATCPVCFDEVIEPVTLECGHNWCRACLSGYLIAAKDNKMFPLTCLGNEANCRQPISLTVARELLSAGDFNAVLEASFVAYVQSRPDEFRYCPTPDCPQVYRVAHRETVLQCPSCLVRICSKCHTEYHDGVTCETRDSSGDKLFKEWRDKHDVKHCPGCRAPIERSEGCNHMTCTQCHTHICWVCLCTFPGGDGIYDHMRTAHGGIGL